MAIQDVSLLAQALHDAGVINTDSKISDVLKIAGVGELNPSSLVSSGAVAWDGYALIYKGIPSGLTELQNITLPTNLNPGPG